MSNRKDSCAVRVRLTRAAEAERNHAILRSSEGDPEAGARLYARFEGALARLGAFPRLGHPGRSPGTREFDVPKTLYTVVYRLEAHAVVVLRFRHQSVRPDR